MPHEREPVDLGPITARPVEGPRGGHVEDDLPGDELPVDQRPLSSLLGDIRSGVSSMAGDIVEARRGPKPNTRPVPDWIRSLAWLLDDSIPVGGGRRVGIDGLISFVPGIGDAAGLVASMVVVLAGVGAGVSLPTLTLMLVHVGIDTIVGAVPFLGAVFDLGYKANTRNLRLIEADLSDRAATRRSSIRVFVLSAVAIFVGWLLFLIALVGGTYLFVRLVASLF
ncbi:MAG: DUF4112 domain-containing protein [Microthrixaceae bacterium]